MDQSLKSISPAFPEIKNSVVLTCDGNYLKFASVTIQSIIENNKNQHLDLIILASDINEWDKNSLLEQANNESISIRIIDISSIFKEIFGNFNLKSKKYWKLSMYYRLLIPFIFDQYDSILYMDCDMILTKSLSRIFNTDFDDNEIIAVQDLYPLTITGKTKQKWASKLLNSGLRDPEKYFNSGMIYFNINKINAQSYLNQLRSILSSHPELIDQDVLNIVFQNKTKFIGPEYNLCPTDYTNTDRLKIFKENHPNYYFTFINAFKDPCILHYCGAKKVWADPNIAYSYLFWKYARNTNFYEQILYSHLVSAEDLKTINSINKTLAFIKLRFYSIKNKTQGGYVGKIEKYQSILKTLKRLGK